MKLCINGVEIEHPFEVKTTSTKQVECKLSKKYPTIKPWCDLIAFLINCNVLASNVEQKH